jgi:outer membrane immunogenic protein
MKKILLATALLALGSVSALAADLPARGMYTKAPMVDPSFNWSGFYLGAQIGAASMSTRLADDTDFFDNQGVNPDRHTGITGGGYAGVNWQFGSFVFGIDGQWSGYDAKTASQPDGPTSSALVQSTIHDAGNVKARVGLALNNTLVYVAAGPAWASSTLAVNTSATTAFTNDKVVSGFAVAGGVEHAISSNLIFRGQLQYATYDTQRVALTGTRTYGQGSDLLEATAGLSFKFGPAW